MRKVSFVAIISVFHLFLFSNISYARPKVFNPQMKPVAGDWGKPVAKIGEAPPAVWSETTVNAGVNKKPLGGKVITKIGEIIDVSCYLQLGKHGKDHEGCGKACILNGQPVGLLEEDGTVYLLMPEEHDPRRDAKVVFANAMVHHVGHIVSVTGTYTVVKGMKSIYVHGFVKKE